LRPQWDQIRVDVMRQVLRIKFKQNSEAKNALLSTADALLVEKSPRDAFWGIGAEGTGQNYLGRLLMQIRCELRQQTESESMSDSKKRRLAQASTLSIEKRPKKHKK